MTTATTQYFTAKPAATNPLLAIVSFLLSVNLRDSLAEASSAQADTGAYTWGM